jgi:hypothetical protein
VIAIGIVVATVAAFVISLAIYAVAPAAPAAPATPAAHAEPATPAAQADAAPTSDRPAPWQIGIEILRSAVVASLVAGLLATAGWDSAGAGALLGLALWALPLVLLAGSVVWERVPVRSAAPHAGDWLIKLVAIGAIIGAFI